MTRNKVEVAPFSISPVEDFTVFSGFSCLSPKDTDRDLDDFILNDAESHCRDKIAVTYGLFMEEFPSPLGFATLQNDAIVIEQEGFPPNEVAGYPYKSFPAVKIGRLGIAFQHQRKSLGTLFLVLLKELMCSENRTGCRFITVDARRDKRNKVDATAFYERNGFALLPYRAKTSRSVPMYFDLMRFKYTAP